MSNMQYILEIDSPDLELIFNSLQSARVAKAVQATQMQRQYGRTSVHARQAHAEVERIGRVLQAVEASRSRAVPERALQSTETPARNVTDDIGRVIGRPRNDPRDARNRPRR